MAPMGSRVCVVVNSLWCSYNLFNLGVKLGARDCVPFALTLSHTTLKTNAHRYWEVTHGCTLSDL